MVKFVNPYTFLPLPQAVKRQPNHGHDGSADTVLYTGSFTVQWQLKSPLLLPENAEEQGWLEPLAKGQTAGDGDQMRNVAIPGSSVKGALRSLHEAAFFGCMSIVDQNYIPVYREAAIKGKRAEESEWTIGIVTDVDEETGRPTLVPTKGLTVWVNAVELIKTQGYTDKELPKTGDILHFNKQSIKRDGARHKVETVNTNGRFVGRGSGDISALRGDNYVIIITDGRARENNKKWFWAARKIDPKAQPLAVPEDVWEHFQAKVAGTDDMRKKKLREAAQQDKRRAPRSKPIESEQENRTVIGAGKIIGGVGKVLGERLLQTGEFTPGDALWMKTTTVDGEKRIEELSYSAIWRRVGQRDNTVMRLRDLLGELAPCDVENEHGVCLSCSLFGPPVADEDDRSPQPTGPIPPQKPGYAGHVRFGGLRLDPSVNKHGVLVRMEENFMPLASPRPSNAQFYMVNPRSLSGKPTKDQHQNGENTAHWDRRDLGKLERKIAGRKFYWNHDPLRKTGSGHLYYRAFEEANEQLVSTRMMVLTNNEGTPATFVSEVVFDQITEQQLMSLWCLLNHDSLLRALRAEQTDTVIRLGGGKPLGFGSVAPKIVGFKVSESKNRYLQDSPQFEGTTSINVLGEGTEFHDQWFDQLKQRVSDEDTGLSLEDNLRALLRVMNLDGLGKDKGLVAYPPNAVWDQYGTKKFHESYKFFGETNGVATAEGWEQWKPLPVLKPENNPQVIE